MPNILLYLLIITTPLNSCEKLLITKCNLKVFATQTLIRDEGFRSSIYKDSLGNDTIGYGFKLSNLSYKKKTITKQEAYKILQIKIFNIDKKLTKKNYYKILKEKQKVAIISMVYQMGWVGFNNFKKTIAALKKKDYKLAREEARQSLWCKQTPKRCLRIIKMI